MFAFNRETFTEPLDLSIRSKGSTSCSPKSLISLPQFNAESIAAQFLSLDQQTRIRMQYPIGNCFPSKFEPSRQRAIQLKRLVPKSKPKPRDIFPSDDQPLSSGASYTSTSSTSSDVTDTKTGTQRTKVLSREAYLERRAKNNLAAKLSRDKRRNFEMQTEVQLNLEEQKHLLLKTLMAHNYQVFGPLYIQ